MMHHSPLLHLATAEEWMWRRDSTPEVRTKVEWLLCHHLALPEHREHASLRGM